MLLFCVKSFIIVFAENDFAAHAFPFLFIPGVIWKKFNWKNVDGIYPLNCLCYIGIHVFESNLIIMFKV